MACIIKMPSEKSKGVISFTNIEYFSQIKERAAALKLINCLKKSWVVCYHPNWEDHHFVDDGVFDCVLNVGSSFSFDKSSNGKKNLIGTCSNRMAPSEFNSIPTSRKCWDFCHVSRDQRSKNILGFFRVVKKALEKKQNLTGILIISVSDKKRMVKIRHEYETIFSIKERHQFEFVTLTYNLPFPLSKKTLAHFYNFSKVSLNTHLNEPHGRVVGYSLASGLPVVGYFPISEMVEKNYRKPPYFFLCNQGDEEGLASRLCEAVDYVQETYNEELHADMAKNFSELEQGYFLKRQLSEIFSLDLDLWNLYSLDLRLSWHYILKSSVNSFNVSVYELLVYLNESKVSGIKCDEESIVDDISMFSRKRIGMYMKVLDWLTVRAPLEKKRFKKLVSEGNFYKLIRPLIRRLRAL